MEVLERLACNGIGKSRDTDNALTVYFNRPLTDDEVNFFNNCILRWARFAPIQYLGAEGHVPAKKIPAPAPRVS